VKQLPLFNLDQVPNQKGKRSDPSSAIPEDIIVAAVELMGAIDLDPYCTNKSVPAIPAKVHFTKEDKALRKEWGPKRRVFLCPPSTRAIGAWIDKLCDEYEAGEISQAVTYIKAAVDSDWLRRLIAYPVCFVERHLRVQRRTTTPPSAVVYLGPNLEGFADAFSLVGPIYVPFEQGQFRRIAPKRSAGQDNSAQKPDKPQAAPTGQSQNGQHRPLTGRHVIQHGPYILTVLFNASYLTITNPAWDVDSFSDEQNWLLQAVLRVPGIIPSRHGHISKTQEGTVKLVFSFQKDHAENVVGAIEAILNPPPDVPEKSRPTKRSSPRDQRKKSR